VSPMYSIYCPLGLSNIQIVSLSSSSPYRDNPILYDWCGDKFIVFSVLDRNGRLNFNRWLPPSLFETWMGVVDETFSYSFENQNDKVSWKWGSKRVCLLNQCMIT